MRTRIILLLAFMPLLSVGATYPYDWEKNRQRYVLSPAEEKTPEIILKDHIEYTYTFENDQFVMYCVYHRIVRVNTNEAIQRHNRISIPMDRTIELVDVKARSINSQNKIVTFDKNNLKELRGEENKSGGRLFAMEGVELGSEVEYYYVRKMMPVLFNNAYMQMNVPIKQISFVLKSPRHLEFAFKSYNGLPEVKKDTTAKENIYTVSMNDLPPSLEEEFAYHIAQKKRLEFKLAYNTAKSRARLNTWDDAAKQFYGRVSKLEKEEEKALEKYVRSLQDNPARPISERIRSIERSIKSSIQHNDESDDKRLSDLAAVTKDKVASSFGFTRLFLHVFRSLNIDAQVALTCSREFLKFDEGFDTWGYLDEYFLFFPETGQYLSPYNQSVAYPIIEPEFTSQKALVIEPVEIGALKSGIATIRLIPAAPYNFNTDNLNISVDFDNQLAGNQVNLKRSFRGYNAVYLARYFEVMTDQQKLEVIDDLLKQTAPGLVVKKWKAAPDFTGEVDAFNMDVDFTSSHFVERAGPRILFKIGLLIGPQTELYNENKRMLSVENSYQRGYERVIQVKIPAGYSIKNPNDMNFSIVYQDGNNVPFSFETSYTIEGQLLTLQINEYYKDLYAPLERYEDFRKVINAAADFNKVTLVLEKKQ